MSLSAWNDVCLSYLSKKSVLEASVSAVQLCSSNSMPVQP